MVNLKILRRAIAVGVMFELLLVVAAHYRPWLKHNFPDVRLHADRGRGGTALCPRPGAGLSRRRLGWREPRARCAAWWRWRSRTSSATGPILYIPWGVMVLTFTGVVGGLFGQLDAMFKAFIRSQK